MTARFAYFKGKWKQQEKQAVLFILKLLFLLTSIKLVFAFFNRDLLAINPAHTVKILLWSVYYDFLVLMFLNLPLFILLWLFSFYYNKPVIQFLSILFILLNTLCLLVNISDIIYFHFHLQRADADLLYVLGSGLGKMIGRH